MLARLKTFIEIEILVAVVSAIFGLLASPLLERITSPLFDTPTRAILAGLLFLALLTTMSVVGNGIFARRFKKDLSSINYRLGLTAKYVSTRQEISGEAYHTARQIIEKAEKEILLLHFVRPRVQTPREHESSAVSRQERKAYIQAIRTKVENQKDFTYKRIFQLSGGTTVRLTSDVIGKQWCEHVRAVLELRKDPKYTGTVSIKKSQVFFEQSFIIVDERYVFWPINAVDPDHEFRYTRGSIFFDDREQALVPHLKKYFERVDARSVAVDQAPEE